LPSLSISDQIPRPDKVAETGHINRILSNNIDIIPNNNQYNMNHKSYQQENINRKIYKKKKKYIKKRQGDEGGREGNKKHK
jgi:hypothetical protein